MSPLVHRSLAAAVALLVVGPAFAYESVRVAANLASDFAECAAYYALMGKCAANTPSQDGKLEASLQSGFEQSVAKSAILSTGETAAARLKLNYDVQMGAIQGDCGNAAILMVNYGMFCKGLLENPAPRIQYWNDKE